MNDVHYRKAMNTENESIKSSGEDYLEAILIIQNRHGAARSIELAQQLNVTKPSVSVAVHALEKKGYLVMDGDKYLHLTDEGRMIAEKIYERHCFLKNALMAIGVEDEQAEDEACRMEHAISDHTFSLMKKYCQQQG